jgi:hypothetical protein
VSAAQILLRRLLEQSSGATEFTYTLVIDSEGLEDLPREISIAKGSFAVHRAATELGLRQLLWKAKGAPLIAVLPEALALRIQKSPDLLRRASDQRVHALSVNDVLEVLLRHRVVGADAQYMQQLALEHVDKLGIALSRRTLPTVVDRRLLTELLVDVSVGEHFRTQTPAELLAGWITEPPQWSANVSQLVREALPTMHGDEGRVLAWALEDEARLRLVVVRGAVLTVEAEVPKVVWGELWKAAHEPPSEMDRRILRRVVSTLAEATLAVLGDGANSLLTEADRLARESLPVGSLATSRVLPLAFQDRARELAQRAAQGHAVPISEVVWLETHRAARMHRAELVILEGLARLSRYLDQPFISNVDIREQVIAYQRDGAFADLAAAQLRRALAGSANYHREAQTVLTKVRERRDRANREFAETLAAGYEAALHHPDLVPLHRLWKRVVAPVWQTNSDSVTGIFLVVLDGCSYPVFLELLYALAQDSNFPVGIRADVEGRVAGIPALAPLPTITSHARGAIFLGELPNDPLVAETVFRDQDEAKTDKARFKQNAALGNRSRQLFLKGDLADGGQALLTALAEPGIEVVAAVFNAVDDQIGSSNTGASVRLRPEDIMAFKPSLQAAIRAGRRVLVTADHGHSPFVDKSRRVGSGKAPRYLGLGPSDAAPDGFLEIDVGGLGGPPQRRAFAWSAGVYLGNPQVGFHGGCGLDEMVVPLVWLEREGLQADEPAWWYGPGAIVERPEVRPVPPPIITPIPTELPAPKPQMSLFDPNDKAEALGLPATLLEKLSIDEKTVLVLLRENGTARATELAERLRKNPGRFKGLMATLRRTLHAEGVVFFTDEVLPTTGDILYRYQPPPSSKGSNQ